MPQEYIESQDVDNDVMSKDFWEQYKKEAKNMCRAQPPYDQTLTNDRDWKIYGQELTQPGETCVENRPILTQPTTRQRGCQIRR